MTVESHERSALPTSAAAHAPPPPYPSTHVPRASIAIRLVTLPMPAAPLSPTPPFALCSAEAATRHSPILKVRGASHASHSSRLASHYSQPRHERRVNRVQLGGCGQTANPILSTNRPQSSWGGPGRPAPALILSPFWPVPRSRSDGAPDQRANAEHAPSGPV